MLCSSSTSYSTAQLKLNEHTEDFPFHRINRSLNLPQRAWASSRNGIKTPNQSESFIISHEHLEGPPDTRGRSAHEQVFAGSKPMARPGIVAQFQGCCATILR
eukprot:TRINITY_DN24346_c0_g1_i1.p1 TRINITY_DN24346_c0_g1~~TRINITY_DN24346_c0_g1_i1.p1  ORF type:complete len:103 (+),score=7.62 TRINITY_DN24346_c0_g1_i1:43-351(+)